MTDTIFDMMSTNLGIYNNHHMYNENINFDINKHIEQGVQFKKYGTKYESDNAHKLLQDSSSPEWSSIVEAMTLPMSINQAQNIVALNRDSPDTATFNNLVSNYATLYKSYTTNMVTKQPSDTQRIAMEKALAQQQEVIVTVAKQIKSGGKGTADTITGKIETTTLNMNSMYYHYFVYFVITGTLLAFTFYMLVNPNASVLNAMYVVGALMAVYVVARRYEL